MGTSRRDFIKKGSLVALVAGVPLSLAQGTVAASETAAPSVAFGLNKATFLAQLNSTFLINEGASKVAVRLVAVTDLPRRGASAGKEAFSPEPLFSTMSAQTCASTKRKSLAPYCAVCG